MCLFFKVQQCIKEISNLAFNAAPCNFMHKYLILDAEFARIMGNLPTHEILSKYTHSVKYNKKILLYVDLFLDQLKKMAF